MIRGTNINKYAIIVAICFAIFWVVNVSVYLCRQNSPQERMSVGQSNRLEYGCYCDNKERLNKTIEVLKRIDRDTSFYVFGRIHQGHYKFSMYDLLSNDILSKYPGVQRKISNIWGEQYVWIKNTRKYYAFDKIMYSELKWPDLRGCFNGDIEYYEYPETPKSEYWVCKIDENWYLYEGPLND